jgi:DHA2 family multidrug resistance protein
VPLALIMTLCLRRGMKLTPINPTRAAAPTGSASPPAARLALIYAALDQGNRLDWLNSGLDLGTAAGRRFAVRELPHPRSRTRRSPLINLKVVFGYPLPFLLLLIAFLRLSILATAYLIPLYLGSTCAAFARSKSGKRCGGSRRRSSSSVRSAGLMLRRSDPRLVASIGFIFIAVACLMVAWNITPSGDRTSFCRRNCCRRSAQSFAYVYQEAQAIASLA